MSDLLLKIINRSQPLSCLLLLLSMAAFAPLPEKSPTNGTGDVLAEIASHEADVIRRRQGTRGF